MKFEEFRSKQIDPLYVQGDGRLHNGYRISENYRGRLLGIEMEFFVVDKYTLSPRNCVDTLRSHSAFGTYLTPEAVNEQIEIRSEPFWELAKIQSQLRALCSEAVEILADVGALLLPVALLNREEFTHSSEDKRILRLYEHLGEPFVRHAGKITSDQINVGGRNFIDACTIFERLRHYVPDIIALSAASPFRGDNTETACNRLDIYEDSLSFAPELMLLPPYFKDLSDYARYIQNQPKFQHPTTSYSLLRPMPHRGVAAEVRCIDKQPSLAETMAFAAFVKALTLSVDVNFPAPTPTGITQYEARTYGCAQAIGFDVLLTQLTELLDNDEKNYLEPLYSRVEVGSFMAQMYNMHGESNAEDLANAIANRFAQEVNCSI